MARAPRDGSGPLVLFPAPRALPGFYRLGSSDRSTGDLTARGRRSVHGRCATAGRRGTDLLAGRRSARTATAGTRTSYGERVDGGLRTRRPGAGEATPAHAPARLPWSMAGAVVEPRSPARRAPRCTRALSQHRHEADSPDCGASATAPGGLSRLFPDDLPPALVFGPGAKAGFGVRGDRNGSRAERHFRHDFACQPAFHPATLSDGYPADTPDLQTCRPACRPWPGRRPWSAAECTCGRDRD